MASCVALKGSLKDDESPVDGTDMAEVEVSARARAACRHSGYSSSKRWIMRSSVASR